MTAHIDKQNQETEQCDCNPHDNHALVKENIKLRDKIAELNFYCFVMFFLLMIAIIARLTDESTIDTACNISSEQVHTKDNRVKD